MLFESKTKKMNKLRVSIIPFNWKIQQEWAFLVWTPGTLERNFQKKKPEKTYARLLKDGSFSEQNSF